MAARGNETSLAEETVEVSLPGDPTAAARARDVVRRTLMSWRLTHLVEACVLVVSELVTNAVRHGRPPLALRLRRADREVALDVHDEGADEVRTPEEDPDELAESGRGLGIVTALADEAKIEAVPGRGTTAHAAWRLDRG